MPRSVAYVRTDKCLRCGTPREQHRRDQKLAPGRFPCITGGSHRFGHWKPSDDPNCKACNPDWLGHFAHTCNTTNN
ncbi:hypothetical protein DRROBERT_27 [Arthrobacter phage DrRobert]|uniref:Uncharacterized protein n=1 Tax=Arthrobacter phage DrRobert TaxID=1772296 RepID=A0A0U4B2F4_9CAUD|nr:hypothetical protein FDH56_gp27 [Arthrobacter phage DrRobert]ALY08846.1 hypothetical protein DRROBERT_27 [Arthrobacter phage DrRobert]